MKRHCSHVGCLEEVVETECAVDGVEGKGHALEVGGEDAVQTPSEVEGDAEVFVGFELAACLHAPLEAAEVVTEIVGSRLHFCFRAGRFLVTDVAVVGRPFERAVHHVGEVGSGFHHPALVEVVGGEHGDGQIVVVHFCLDLSGPCSAHGAATSSFTASM